jgi:hypothetical protein
MQERPVNVTDKDVDARAAALQARPADCLSSSQLAIFGQVRGASA